MNYQDQWKALSIRIRGLMQAGETHARYLAVNSGDGLGRGKHLLAQSNTLRLAIERFHDDFQSVLPPEAKECIGDFLSGRIKEITGGKVAPPVVQDAAFTALVHLATFESEMSFALSNTQQTIRALSERAFDHLQRLIVVDPSYQDKWIEAFKKGEVACEKLGAVHLLQHGIFAFKVDATGARTDLVYQDRVGTPGTEIGYVDGLVLTEWKTAKPDEKAPEEFTNARKQAKRYAGGVLAGTELRGYRYAIVVTRHQVEAPDDATEEHVVYRHINIAVEPKTPSKAA